MQNMEELATGHKGSDHHLVVVKVKLLALKKPRSTRRKCCTHRLRDQSVREEFVIALATRYDALYNGSDDGEEVELDVEQEWNKIKEMYSSTCKVFSI